MRHTRAARRLSEYLDGALTGRAAKQVEAHLDRCAACRMELGELHRTTQLLRELRGADEAPDLSSAILSRIARGEADASLLDRLRFGTTRLLSSAWMAPVATAAVGLALLSFVPRIEIEVSLPGIAHTESPAAEARTPAPRPTAMAPLATRRVAESVPPPSLQAPGRLPVLAVDCWEQPSFEACQEQQSIFMDLALRDPREFVARLDDVPAPDRERLVAEVSRLVAEAGSGPAVAERLRASDDPRAWQVATHFESAIFDGR